MARKQEIINSGSVNEKKQRSEGKNWMIRGRNRRKKVHKMKKKLIYLKKKSISRTEEGEGEYIKIGARPQPYRKTILIKKIQTI